MEYMINETALPTFFARNDAAYIVSPTCILASNPITALHYHNVTEIGLCLSGSGETHIGSKVYSYSAGCIHIIPPNVPHLSNSKMEDESKWIFISFNANEVLKNLGMFGAEYITLLTNTENIVCGLYDKDELPELTAAVMGIIKASKERGALSDVALFLAIVQFLIASARAKSTLRSTDASVLVNSPGKIAPAIEFIGYNLDDSEALSEKNLAGICGISVATLRRLFNKSTGYSPKAFIVRSRMAHAEYLLRKSNLSVTEIAEYVGYGEISGFNKTFKSFFGTSPLKYRNAQADFSDKG